MRTPPEGASNKQLSMAASKLHELLQADRSVNASDFNSDAMVEDGTPEFDGLVAEEEGHEDIARLRIALAQLDDAFLEEFLLHCHEEGRYPTERSDQVTDEGMGLIAQYMLDHHIPGTFADRPNDESDEHLGRLLYRDGSTRKNLRFSHFPESPAEAKDIKATTMGLIVQRAEAIVFERTGKDPRELRAPRAPNPRLDEMWAQFDPREFIRKALGDEAADAVFGPSAESGKDHE